ncbi:hypothetical protein V6N13_091236 [Hibiscus sabdariffa]|uniref:Hexosyltransferase n=1 Tax=Hibiscus sabdariffa TaxID=183260 RepID=A0ABR2BUZ3_9ROSI
MALWRTLSIPIASPPDLILSFLFLHIAVTTAVAIRVRTIIHNPSPVTLPVFREAPAFRNGDSCGSNKSDLIHIAMTLDENYIRGTMAAVLSMLQHSNCPENLSFHFLCAHSDVELVSSIQSTFPYLNSKIYRFNSNRVRGKISKSTSIRPAIELRKDIFG